MKRNVKILKRMNRARIVGIYLLIGVAWIIFPDVLDSSGGATMAVATVKGLVFVFLTGGLLYWLLCREMADTSLLQLALQQGPFGVGVLDGDGQLISHSEKFEQLVGAGANLPQLLDIAATLNSLGKDDLSTSRQIDRSIAGENGKLRFLSVTLIKAERMTAKVAFVCICEDITHQRELEREVGKMEESLREVQRMEILGQVAGGAAHDFNNHLQVLGGYARLLAEEDDMGNRQEMLAEMERSLEQASTLSQKLLTFARRHKSNMSMVDLRDLCEEAVGLISAALPREISLSMELCDEPLMVEADSDEFGRVLANLCLNARDAITGAGKILIYASRFEAREADDDLAPGSYARVEVADTGSGMDEATLKQIFAPFFTTKGNEGTGLGLATSHGIVKQHKGVIRATSFPGRGATFDVYLPLAGARDISLVLDRGDDRTTILLAERDPEVLALTSRLLSRSGYSVIGTKSIDEARRLFDEHLGRIDVVVIDLESVYVSGGEIYDYIRQAAPAMPVIFSRGYFIEESRPVPQDVLRINSPSSPDVLKAAIEIALRSKPGGFTTVTR